MDTRCWHRFLTLSAISLIFLVLPSQCAPAFKLKHFNYYNSKPQKQNFNRLERRLIGGSSPIHFISPFSAQPISNPFEQFFVPQMPLSVPQMPLKQKFQKFVSPSNIYKLNLQMIANGKPHSVMRGLPKKHQQMLDFAASSNVIRLPLKYMSNAKPIGVYFKDRSLNYI